MAYIKKDWTGGKYTDLYWDCKCPKVYIHSIQEPFCEHCNMKREDGTDSIAQEVVDMFSHKRGKKHEQ